VHDRVGKIELSTCGTLFLDEIESITLNMQLKLLRVLEEREVERLGGNRKVKVNMRVIAATNVELSELVADGRMRRTSSTASTWCRSGSRRCAIASRTSRCS
jgi:transcriptional regulator with PAS, ATPase and Fis domain